MPAKKRKFIILAVVAAFLLALIAWIVWGNTALELNTYTISSSKLPQSFDGYRIAHVSDLHNAEMGKDVSLYYKFFYHNNISVNMIPVDADFSKYKIVVAPVLYMVKAGMKEALTKFVENGGILITTFMSGLVDESDNVHLGGYPGPLRELAGVWVEEIDALAPEQTNTITFTDGTRMTCNLLCDLMHLEGAQMLASYDENFYAGMPAITKNQFGKGFTYYIGTNMDQEGIDKVLKMATHQADIHPVVDEPTALEVVCRRTADSTHYYIFNFKETDIVIPDQFVGFTDLLTGKKVESGMRMKQYDALILNMPDSGV